MPVSFRLGPQLEERLSDLAQSTGRTKSFYVREALERELARMEREYPPVQGEGGEGVSDFQDERGE